MDSPAPVAPFPGLAAHAPGVALGGYRARAAGGRQTKLGRQWGLKTGGDWSGVYNGDSWLFMSPLKWSNFLSVSSLKEPPVGGRVQGSW